MRDNEWNDDEGFYDEAWKDMSARLDAAPGRRPIWPWALLLPFIILAGWLALFGIPPNIELAAPESEPTPARPRLTRSQSRLVLQHKVKGFKRMNP